MVLHNHVDEILCILSGIYTIAQNRSDCFSDGNTCLQLPQAYGIQIAFAWKIE